MAKFEFTVISRGIEVDAADEEAALAEIRRLYEEGELGEMSGWLRVQASNDEGDVWETIDEYHRD